MFFIIALVFTFIIKIRFPKEVSIATILKREESDANFPDKNLQRHSVTHSKLRAHWLMTLVRGGGLGVLQELQRLLSLLLSMTGVCGRSLTAGKIILTGRQTCSLYLVL